jgi:hypothetical protein
MKRKSLIFLFMILAGFAFAQTPAQPTQSAPTELKPLGEALSWLEGNWEGQGVMAGDNQEFTGTLSGQRELDDEALILRRESIGKSQQAGLKEIMLIGFEASTKKIILTLLTSKNAIGIYTGELKDHEIVFTLATAQQGYVDRRSFKQLPDGGISFTIERGTPDKAVGKVVEINFKKKS